MRMRLKLKSTLPHNQENNILSQKQESLQEETLRRPTILSEQADSEPETVQPRRV